MATRSSHPSHHSTLEIPERAAAVAVFAHGSGSGRHGARDRQVAAALRQGGLATPLTGKEAANRRKPS